MNTFIDNIKSELRELARLGMLSRPHLARCEKYLAKHARDFDEAVTGPMSTSEAADLVRDVA